MLRRGKFKARVILVILGQSPNCQKGKNGTVPKLPKGKKWDCPKITKKEKKGQTPEFPRKVNYEKKKLCIYTNIIYINKYNDIFIF